MPGIRLGETTSIDDSILDGWISECHMTDGARRRFGAAGLGVLPMRVCEEQVRVDGLDGLFGDENEQGRSSEVATAGIAEHQCHPAIVKELASQGRAHE